jgi:hypothetical protein
LITLCIATFHRPAELRACIDSAMAGSVKPDKVLICDMAGDCGVPDAYVSPEGWGLAKGLNWLLRNSSDIRIIANDDVMFSHRSIERIVNEVNAGCEFVSAWFMACYSLTDACIGKVGYFDEDLSPGWIYFEDNDYYWRMLAQDIKTKVIEAEIIHDRDASNTPTGDPRFEQARVRYNKKWGGDPGQEKIAAPGPAALCAPPVDNSMKIMVATPAHDSRVSVFYTDALIQTMKVVPNVLPVFHPGNAVIQMARNILFQLAHKLGVAMIIWIDSDMAWRPQAFRALVNDPRDFVTGMYRLKTDDVRYVLCEPNDEDQTTAGCGMGFCKMTKKVIDALWDSSPVYGDEDNELRNVFSVEIEDGKLYSEDLSACRKWTALSPENKIYFLPEARVAHVGTKIYE